MAARSVSTHSQGPRKSLWRVGGRGGRTSAQPRSSDTSWPVAQGLGVQGCRAVSYPQGDDLGAVAAPAELGADAGPCHSAPRTYAASTGFPLCARRDALPSPAGSGAAEALPGARAGGTIIVQCDPGGGEEDRERAREASGRRRPLSGRGAGGGRAGLGATMRVVGGAGSPGWQQLQIGFSCAKVQKRKKSRVRTENIR